ncbi:3-hydroxyacyl-CoA dehydrogenase family protein, partial [Chloroflexota bacterium]
MEKSDIKKVAVVGAGMMGTGIGLEFARFGYDVALQARKETTLQKAMEEAREGLDLMVEAKFISADTAKAALSRMRTTNDMANAVSGADWVVESVFEDLRLKQEIFAKLDEICPPNVILASNASSQRVDDMNVNATKHPERILLTHYW